MSGALSARARRDLCAHLGRFIEADLWGSRWIAFPFALVLLGPSGKTSTRDGGCEARKGVVLTQVIAMTLGHVRAAKPVEVHRACPGSVTMGPRRLDAEYVGAIELAYPECSWWLSAPIRFAGARYDTTDRLAYAYSGGRLVAALAPWREGMS